MKIYGLIGYPLSHSFSQNYFREKFEKENIAECDYQLFPIESVDELPDLLMINNDCCGLNVTIPHKENVIAHLDEVDETAEAIGAVNTILIKDGKRKGFNTDVLGFQQSLEPLLNEGHYRGGLVLGTGGASKAIQYVLEKLNIPCQLVSRTRKENAISYEDLTSEILDQHPIIVNTTPLGMSPMVDEAPQIEYDQLSDQHLLYDLTYNPEKTKFLRLGEAQGASIKNGYEMLEIQAEESWKIWMA